MSTAANAGENQTAVVAGFSIWDLGRVDYLIFVYVEHVGFLHFLLMVVSLQLNEKKIPLRQKFLRCYSLGKLRKYKRIISYLCVAIL